MQTARILIVEDEKEARVTLESFLSKRISCEFLEAENGYKAIEIVKSTPIDLILLDIKMPGISGVDVIKSISDPNKKIPIIVLTKWDSEEVAQVIKEYGADYLTKPYSLKLVLEKVKEKLIKINKYLEKTPA